MGTVSTIRAHLSQLFFPKLAPGKGVVSVDRLVQQIYHRITSNSYKLGTRMREYRFMLEDATVAAAVEIMADEATQYDATRNRTVWPEAQDNNIEVSIEDILDIARVEDRIWQLSYDLATYGEWYWWLHFDDQGRLQDVEDIHPENVERISYMGRLVCFLVNSKASKTGQDIMLEPWQMVHFRVSEGGSNWRNEDKRQNEQERRVDLIVDGQKITVIVEQRGGQSMLESGRKVYKMLKTVEDSIVMQRLVNAAIRYFITVNTEGMIPEQAKETIDRVEALVNKQDWKIDDAGLEVQFDIAGARNSVVIPTGGGNGINVTKFGADYEAGRIFDVEYLRNKLIGALKVPAVYLGFAKEMPSSLGEGPISKMDVRLGRTVNRLSRARQVGLSRFIQIALAARGIMSMDWSLQYVAPTTADDQSKRDAMRKTVETLDFVVKKDIEFKTNVIRPQALATMMETILLDAGYAAIISNPDVKKSIKEYSYSLVGDLKEALPKSTKEIKILTEEYNKAVQKLFKDEKEAPEEKNENENNNS